MYFQLFIINNIYFLSVKIILLDMTINNPIFIFSLITFIWFIPGIVVRRINKSKQIKKKERSQAAAIKKLYPNPEDFED